MKNIKYFRETAVITVLATIFITIAVARNYVANYYSEGKGYHWSAMASTSVGLPLMFAKCNFHYTGYYDNNCDQSVMLYGDNNDNWVNCGGIGAVGERVELYPNNLEVLYYSFNEKKFYGGKFKLDYNKILSVAEKIRKAVQDQESSIITKSINFQVKAYPKGKVVFSMESYIETQLGEIVIATFQAKPENHDWSVFERRGQSSVGGIGESNSIEVQRALLLNKYNWQVQIVLPKEFTFSKLNVEVFGDKGFEMDTIKNTKTPTYSNFIYLPKELNITWNRKDTIEFSTNFHFNEEEIIKAFETTSNNGKLPNIMQLIVKDDTTALRTILQGNGKKIELKDNHPSEIYSHKIYKTSE